MITQSERMTTVEAGDTVIIGDRYTFDCDIVQRVDETSARFGHPMRRGFWLPKTWLIVIKKGTEA